MYFNLVFLCLFLVKNSFYVTSTTLDTVDTRLEEFPFVAFILATWGCPAALITENYLITPAFCVENASHAQVYVGTSRQPNWSDYTEDENTQKYNTSHILVHEDFATRIDESHHVNNIALIKLQQPVTLTDQVRPGKLISMEPNQIYKENLAQVIGWWQGYNTDMQAETVELLNQTICNFYFGRSFSKNQELCALSGSSTYLNIIGNVLTVNKKIAGFKVKRYSCTTDIDSGRCFQTHVFLNIAPFLYWISQNVGVSVAKLTANTVDAGFTNMENLEKINDEKLESIFAQIDVTNKKLNEIDNELEEKIENKLLKQEEYLSNLENEIKATTGNIQNENGQNYNELKENIKQVERNLNDFLYEQKSNHIKMEERYNDIIHKENSLSNDIWTLNKNIDKLVELMGASPKSN